MKTFDSSFGVYASNPSEVYPNHYGASDLRVALKTMATDTSYFTTAEQGLMNATTVTTNDRKNSVPYTTKDKLYTAQATGLSNSNYKLPDSGTTKEFTIRNAAQTAPSLTGVNENIKGKADGKITGLTTDMEYRIATQSAFTAVTDADMTFAAGTYEVRYAAKPNYDASPAAAVTISEGRMLTVTLPQAEEQIGYTLTAGKAQLAWKEVTTLTFALTPGYSKLDHFAVKAVYTGSENNAGNVTMADNGDGTYTISNVTGDVKVTVEGVADVTAPTAEIKIDTNRWKKFWNTVTFGLFFKNTKTVTITASDNATTSPKIEYYLPDKELTDTEAKPNSITWINYTEEFSINANSKKIVYAKVTDEVGNTTIVNSDGVVIYKDSTPEAANISYTYKENADRTVTIAVNGNTVKEITGGTKVLTKDTDYTVGTDGTITIKAAYLDTLKASDTAYTLTVIYIPLGVEYVAGEGSEASAQTVISVKVERAKVTPGMPDTTKSVSYNTKTVGDVKLPQGWAWQESDKNTALEVGKAGMLFAVRWTMPKQEKPLP